MRLRVSIESPLYTDLTVYIDNISTVSQNITFMRMRFKKQGYSRDWIFIVVAH